MRGCPCDRELVAHVCHVPLSLMLRSSGPSYIARTVCGVSSSSPSASEKSAPIARKVFQIKHGSPSRKIMITSHSHVVSSIEVEVVVSRASRTVRCPRSETESRVGALAVLLYYGSQYIDYVLYWYSSDVTTRGQAYSKNASRLQHVQTGYSTD